MLQAFLALAECRQFTLAAKRCHLSQSAFSQMIGRLEAQAGTRLFDRNTRSVSLTPEGELLLPVARRIAAESTAVFTELRDLAQRKKGRVAVAALPSLSAEWLPNLIAQFRRSHPGIKVQLFDTVSDRAMDLLRRGMVDFALNAQVEHLQEFETRPLLQEKFYLVCSRHHPLARYKTLSLKSLTGCDYVQSVRSGSVSQQLAPFLEGIALNHTGLEVEHLSTLAGLVANNVGVSVVPASSLFQFHRLEIVAIPMSDRGLRRNLQVVRRRGELLSVAAGALLELIEAHPPRLGKSGTVASVGAAGRL